MPQLRMVSRSVFQPILTAALATSLPPQNSTGSFVRVGGPGCVPTRIPGLHDPNVENLHRGLKQFDLGTRELPWSMRVCMRTDLRSGSGPHTDALCSPPGLSGDGTERDLVRFFRCPSHSASISTTRARNWLITTTRSSCPFGRVTGTTDSVARVISWRILANRAKPASKSLCLATRSSSRRDNRIWERLMNVSHSSNWAANGSQASPFATADSDSPRASNALCNRSARDCTLATTSSGFRRAPPDCPRCHRLGTCCGQDCLGSRPSETDGHCQSAEPP